jgi:hypothetical protein
MKVVEIVALAVLLASVSSFNLKAISINKETLQLGTGNIQSGLQGFTNRTGSMFGTAQLNSFINFINSASTFYRDDVDQNLRYIQSQMTTAYGASSTYYGVVIQINSTYTYSNWIAYNAGGENFATLASGINKISPTWSYLIYSVYVQSYLNFVSLRSWGQGSGISDSTATVIKNVIFSNDGTSTCTCGNTYSISGALNKYDSQSWNVVCHTYQPPRPTPSWLLKTSNGGSALPTTASTPFTSFDPSSNHSHYKSIMNII